MFQVSIKFVDNEFSVPDQIWQGRLPHIPRIGDTLTIPHPTGDAATTVILGDYEADRAVVASVHHSLPNTTATGDHYEINTELICSLIWEAGALKPPRNPSV